MFKLKKTMFNIFVVVQKLIMSARETLKDNADCID